MAIYKRVIRPLAFRIDAELAHRLAMHSLELFQFIPGSSSYFECEDPKLQIETAGLVFTNPIGLAAGFDKDGKHIRALSTLGFGFLEIGTVTFHPQPGNPRPRVLRIPEVKGLWNHLGFNNEGAEALANRLKRCESSRPLGINLGKSRIVPLEKAAEDYSASFKQLYPYGDYFVINVSSPNTPGLRKLQDKDSLLTLLKEIQSHNKLVKPILVKVSPDLEMNAVEELLEVALESKVKGFVATNTTLSRVGLPSTLSNEGGVSGLPLRARSTEMIRFIRKSVGKEFCIIGSGGVFDAKDAYDKIKAGASLVQVYTGLIYEGPGLIRQIKKNLLALLQQDAIPTLESAVGIDIR